MPGWAPRSWPIRWRLTAINVGVLALTVLVLGGVFMSQLERALLEIAADHLRDQARPVLQLWRNPRQGGRAGADDQLRQAASPLGRAPTLLVRSLSGPDTGVLVFDQSGGLVAATEPGEEQEPWPPPPDEAVGAALAGTEQRLVLDRGGQRTLVLAMPMVNAAGETVGVLTLASSLQLIDQLEAHLRAALAGGVLVATLLAGFLGLQATRSALRPLDRVIRSARGIGAGRLNARLRMERTDEIGALAEAFDSMLDRLAGAMAAQRRFVADAAHELRTPLTALGGMVEMLQLGADRGDRATIERMLGSMEREIGRLSRLVSDLLTLSRLDGEPELTLGRVELAPLVTDVAAQARLLARGQRVEARIEDAPIILGDADRLKQVLLNLAANAIAFTPPDGEIELRLERANGHARLVVADSGSGIAPELLPRIMGRFERGDPSRARATGGSGLGLAIAQGIVEAHGGTITLESEVGRGTSAIVELPLPSGNPQESRRLASGR
jgi:signal transduction histidine kinase